MVSLYNQLFRFGVAGIINALIDFGLFNLLVYISGIHGGWYLVLINIFSVGIAAVNSYMLNRHWTFHTANKYHNEPIAKFIVATSLGALINTLVVSVVSLLVPVVPLYPYLLLNIGKLLGVFFSSAWNFLVYRHWVFVANLQPDFQAVTSTQDKR